MWERIRKIAILNSFKLILKQNVKRCGNAVPTRSHPSTPDCACRAIFIRHGSLLLMLAWAWIY